MSITIKSIVTAAAFVATTMVSATGFAADAPKSVVGTPAVNRLTQNLIKRMDTDKSGTVSKAEFMKFMEDEFNSLDKDKSGVLQVNEMTRGMFTGYAGESD